MASSSKQLENLDAELDALNTPTSAQVYQVSRDYDGDLVAASAVGRAINGGGGGGGGSQPINVASVSVSSAEIMEMFSSPKEIIAAPAAGHGIFVLGAVLVFTAGGTPYDVSGAGAVLFGPSGKVADVGGRFDGSIFANAADSIAGNSAFPLDFGAFVVPSDFERAWVVTFESDDPALPAGDGTALVIAWYSTVALP